MRKEIFDYRLGLVLSGGGAKGAYQAGFYQALWDLELNQSVKAISGTSIGALNGALFAMNRREILEEIWKKASFAKLFEGEDADKRRFVALAKRYHDQRSRQKLPDFLRENEVSLFSQEGIRRIIQENLDMETLNASGKEVYACAYHIEAGHPVYFSLNEANPAHFGDILMASSALPLVFRPVCIDGIYYSDGGVPSPFSPHGRGDKIPTAPLQGKDLDLIIVLYLRHDDEADLVGFADVPVLEVYPHEPLEKIRGAGTLDLSASGVRRKMDMGYRDAMVILGPIITGLLHGKDLRELVARQNLKNAELRRLYG